jgi:site-specific DNA-cytosine methylase
LVVVSLFDGIGGAFQACKDAPFKLVGVASETCPDAVKVTAASFPHVLHVGDVCKLSAGTVLRIATDAKAKRIIVASLVRNCHQLTRNAAMKV